jgi:Flp pilus assembly protein TadD
VEIPPEWSQSGDSLVLNRHVNAVVPGDEGRSRTVDFNVEDLRVAYDQRAISDARAFAHVHSNIGVERMQAGDNAAALAHYRRAIDYDPGYVSTWVNLGALFLRTGQEARAVAAWQHAARLSPDDTVPLSNLERVYRQRGELARADDLSRRIQGHRQQNPYYRYFLAQQAFAAGDYQGAIPHLRFAIRRKPNDDRFYALLGLSYLRSGDSVAAQRWITRAAAVAGDEGLQRRYESKLGRLRGRG